MIYCRVGIKHTWHRDRVVKVIHSRWIGRETAQVQILSVLQVYADSKSILAAW